MTSHVYIDTLAAFVVCSMYERDHLTADITTNPQRNTRQPYYPSNSRYWISCALSTAAKRSLKNKNKKSWTDFQIVVLNYCVAAKETA